MCVCVWGGGGGGGYIHLGFMLDISLEMTGLDFY